MDRRGFVRVITVGVAAAWVASPARASLARAVGLEELTARSQHVLLGEPLDAECVWERIGQRRHIVTYTRVRALELFAGADPRQDELLLRTLGGQVGELGELVHGEAVLQLGQRGMLFVMPVEGTLAVTAMAQGHYPVRNDSGGRQRLLRSPEATEILGEAGSAVTRLPGLDLAEARALLKPVRH
jgi:hypothetical protein